MKVQLIANVAVLTAGIKADVLKKVQKLAPEALTLKQVDPATHKSTAVFKYSMGTCDTGAVSQHGITFDGVNQEGYPTVTLTDGCTCAPAETRKESFMEQYATAIKRANALEDAIIEAMEDINSTMATVESSIELLD